MMPSSYQYPPPYQYPPQYVYPPPPKQKPAPVVASSAVIGFAMLAIVGSFMPWASATALFVGEISFAGTSSEAGWITVLMSLALGLIGGLSLVPGWIWRVAMFAVALFLGLATVAWAGLVLSFSVSELDTASDMGVAASVGPGPVVVLIAGMGAAFAATYGVVIGSREIANSSSPPPSWPTYYPT